MDQCELPAFTEVGATGDVQRLMTERGRVGQNAVIEKRFGVAEIVGVDLIGKRGRLPAAIADALGVVGDVVVGVNGLRVGGVCAKGAKSRGGDRRKRQSTFHGSLNPE